MLVDEYQDTSYIQEQIITRLASATGSNNLCVVGDEDQSLYRFRGATVRNILTFSKKFGCQPVYLTENYRSHPEIVHTCNQWIQTIDWSNPAPGGFTFRTDKKIQPASTQPAKYPAVFTMTGINVAEEAEQLADLISLLKEQGKISDYHEVAILLYSVMPFLSEAYITALTKRGILVFCPRARKYFEQEEVCLIVGCYVYLLGYRVKSIIQHDERDAFPAYLKDCLDRLVQQCERVQALKTELRDIASEIASATEQQAAKGLADYFYRLVFTEPFRGFLQEKRQRQNLVIFSQLLQTFQNYYHHTSITCDKTMPRLDDDSDWLRLYQQQLYIYAHALEKRTGKLPERLLLYWTAEERKEDALMVIPYQQETVQQFGLRFDEIVSLIQQQQFAVKVPPEPKVCRGCDIRHLCMKEGIIQPVHNPPTKATVGVPGRP